MSKIKDNYIPITIDDVETLSEEEFKNIVNNLTQFIVNDIDGLPINIKYIIDIDDLIRVLDCLAEDDKSIILNKYLFDALKRSDFDIDKWEKEYPDYPASKPGHFTAYYKKPDNSPRLPTKPNKPKDNNNKKFKKVRHSKIYKANCHLPLSTSREMKKKMGRKTWRKFRKRLSFTDYKRHEYYIPWIKQKLSKRDLNRLPNNTDNYKKETSKHNPNYEFRLLEETPNYRFRLLEETIQNKIIQDNINIIQQLGRSAGKHMLEVTH